MIQVAIATVIWALLLFVIAYSFSKSFREGFDNVVKCKKGDMEACKWVEELFKKTAKYLEWPQVEKALKTAIAVFMASITALFLLFLALLLL
ncbi:MULTISPECIES: hypothetical protein [Pyrobaculum]|uniref:Uncharacterized protein n=2 Tax=Pyrobaculum arsenaticum TaxID=121277 RepID=A4WK06_PYRAR|nr:hypothetical protein [Pyrobaculum arsenaticum]ABP50723.1 hypothetical protein Pars_1149 [Pyrobaculum arsenaticum DSM 13514]MCY0891274.1 hypothetical protein [Pyrobaculum arsenaticum]NYR15556.1 hypothetical protein [Pyrobaculum arsenaticum]